MTFKVLFSKEARLDLFEHTEYYHQSAGKKIAKVFYTEVQQTIKVLKSYPYFQISHDSFRKIPLKKFPFVIFYTIIEDSILIVRIFHTAQNPKNYPKKGLK